MRFLSSHLEVQKGFEPIFQGSSLEELWSHPDLQTFKSKKDREILTLELDSNTFFVKRYHGPGVGFLHYVLRGFRDRYGPENEWQKANFLKKLGIRAVEPVVFGIERRYGIIRRALVVTRKMEGSRVEDLLREKTDLDQKTRLVKKLAAFAARFHSLGLSHQDFYLCHLFWSPKSAEIGLIDLQRIRYFRGKNVQPRLSWVVKDLAQLDYSARNILGSEEYDYLKDTFVSVYEGYLPLIAEPRIIRKIQRKVSRIARHDRKLQARSSEEIT
ncbi:MAG: lipopolysaccharide kinase InaA family protein [Syntrophobacterales bacterium]|jgi:heptose I phosphotransferase